MDKTGQVTVYADAAFRATVVTRDFIEAEIVPVIYGRFHASLFEEALTGLFYRMALWGRSLALLGDPNHLQAVRSGARAAFELYLDIHLLANDPTLADRMFAFTKVWKFHSASKMVNFLKEHTDITDPVLRHQRTLVEDANSRKEYEGLLALHWPTNPLKPSKSGDTKKAPKQKIPDDWSGKSIYEKAAMAGPEFEFRYRDEYGITCLFVHSGLVMVDGMSNEALINAFALGHVNFQKSYVKATQIVCDALRVLDAQPGLKSRLRELEDIPQAILTRILMAKSGIDVDSEGD